MTELAKNQSLTSKIIKILRITNEPLSAHAISDTYKLSNKKVKMILAELEEDNLIYSIKTSRGKFYFLPDKYFKRKKDFLDSEDIPPYIWYEELSDLELENRKERILDQIIQLKELFGEKEISGSDFFKKFHEKNEEISIINQILLDRANKRAKCYHCGFDLVSDEEKCSHCKQQHPLCPVCKRSIFRNDEIVKCPKCDILAHRTHMIEWLKSIGNCPNCKKHILVENLIVEEEKEK